MAWIESHQSLRLHPKTLFVCAALKAKRHAIIGHLQCLWWWGLDVADLDGWLPAGTNALTVAGGAEWPDKGADSFLAALLGAGFLEEEGGRYRLHDWWDFAGKYNAKRAANKQRMRDARATHVQGLPTKPTSTTKPTNQSNLPAAAPLPGAIFRLYENLCGTVNGLIAQELTEAETEYPDEWIQAAFKEAAEQNVRKWKYVKAILERYGTEGFGEPNDDAFEDIEADIERRAAVWRGHYERQQAQAN